MELQISESSLLCLNIRSQVLVIPISHIGYIKTKKVYYHLHSENV